MVVDARRSKGGSGSTTIHFGRSRFSRGTASKGDFSLRTSRAGAVTRILSRSFSCQRIAPWATHRSAAIRVDFSSSGSPPGTWRRVTSSVAMLSASTIVSTPLRDRPPSAAPAPPPAAKGASTRRPKAISSPGGPSALAGQQLDLRRAHHLHRDPRRQPNLIAIGRQHQQPLPGKEHLLFRHALPRAAVRVEGQEDLVLGVVAGDLLRRHERAQADSACSPRPAGGNFASVCGGFSTRSGQSLRLDPGDRLRPDRRGWSCRRLARRRRRVAALGGGGVPAVVPGKGG